VFINKHLIGLSYFIIGIKTNQSAGGALAVIILVASNIQNDNNGLKLIS